MAKDEIEIKFGDKKHWFNNPPCPNGHGPMTFYENEEDEDGMKDADFYECPECGYKEEV